MQDGISQKGILTRKRRLFNTQNSPAMNTQLPQSPSTPVGGHPSKICTGMAQNYPRSLGTKYNLGLSHPFFSHSATEKHSPPQCQYPSMINDQRAGYNFVGGSSIVVGEIGHNMSFWSSRPWVL